MLRILINHLIGRTLFESDTSHELHHDPAQRTPVGDRTYDLNFLRRKMAIWLNKRRIPSFIVRKTDLFPSMQPPRSIALMALLPRLKR